MQHRARPPGAAGEARRQGRRRHAARVHDDHRHRRHRHGACRHEVVAGLARGDRRFRRTDGARPLLRRAGRPRRMRQVAARHDDGDGPAERAVGVHLRRLDSARPLQGQGRDGAGRLRGGRQPLRRADVGRGPARTRVRRLSVGRVVWRPVHRQHDGLRRRGDRPGAARLVRRAGALRVRGTRCARRRAGR